jgi:hypothetical protein
MSAYTNYYNRTRTHLTLGKDAPVSRSVGSPRGSLKNSRTRLNGGAAPLDADLRRNRAGFRYRPMRPYRE